VINPGFRFNAEQLHFLGKGQVRSNLESWPKIARSIEFFRKNIHKITKRNDLSDSLLTSSMAALPAPGLRWFSRARLAILSSFRASITIIRPSAAIALLRLHVPAYGQRPVGHFSRVSPSEALYSPPGELWISRAGAKASGASLHKIAVLFKLVPVEGYSLSRDRKLRERW
jgi:hypothetical protein